MIEEFLSMVANDDQDGIFEKPHGPQGLDDFSEMHVRPLDFSVGESHKMFQISGVHSRIDLLASFDLRPVDIPGVIRIELRVIGGRRNVIVVRIPVLQKEKEFSLLIRSTAQNPDF